MDVWFRTGHWPSRKFPAEFPEDAPARHYGKPIKLDDVPVGDKFEVFHQSEWVDCLRVPPPKKLRFEVEVEVEGYETKEAIQSLIEADLDTKHLREVTVKSGSEVWTSKLSEEIRAMVLRSDQHPTGTHEKDRHGIPSCTQLIADLTTLLERSAARIERLEGVIVEASNTLYDTRAFDVEHSIACHLDTLPEVFRTVAGGADKALDMLQVIVQERFEEMEPS
jgi:hypothetical protein